MTECIAMAIGVILGAGCVMLAQIQNAKCRMQSDTSSTAGGITHQEEGLNEREALEKQIENFLNYNGTGEGQMPIDGQ